MFVLTNFIFSKEVRDLSRGQQVVDQNQELLIGNLSIAHKEGRWEILESRLLVEVAHVSLQVGDAVAFPQCDLVILDIRNRNILVDDNLKHFHGGDVSSQSRERLLAASANSNEKCIPTRALQFIGSDEEKFGEDIYLQDSIDAAHMRHCILK